MKMLNSNPKLLLKIQYVLLALAIITEPIYAWPQRFQIPFLGAKLSNYFIVLGLVVFFVDIFLSKIKISNKIKRYIIILLLWTIISEIHGLIVYPFYDEINPESSAKLSLLLRFLHNWKMENLPVTGIESCWLWARGFNNSIKELIYSFIVSAWVISLFKTSFANGFITIRKFVILLAFCLGIYAIPEILLFKFHLQVGYDILSVTNPFLYDVGKYLDWYPPLVWQNEQLRSYCTEPSLFGFLAASILPFAWSYFMVEMRLSTCVLYSYFVMLLFMTKSRTANAVALFDTIALLPVAVNKKWRKMAGILIALTFIGFSMNIGLNFIPKSTFVPETEKEETFVAYYNDNMKSIVEKNSRSNGSRLINMKAHLRVFLEHPVFGVGHDLKDGYVRDRLVHEDLHNEEIRNITKSFNEKGPLGPASYGNVNHYIYVLVNTGLVGLGLYLFPFGYVLYKAIKLKLWHDFRVVTLIIALLGNLIAQMAGEGMILLYIILGLLYIAVEQKSEIKDEL